MGKKRRLSFRIEDDEAVVVAPVEFWEHVQLVYRAYAGDRIEDRHLFLEAADYVGKWVEDTRLRNGEEEEDEF